MRSPHNFKTVRQFSSSSRKSGFRIRKKQLLKKDTETKGSWEWYEPPENSAPVNFFLNTSIHGLHYLGEKKRHLCERFFWFVAFSAATITATVLIWHMWNSYVTMPIVTVFNPTENTLDQLPFPSVTVCSVNNVKKSKWEEYERLAREGLQGKVSNETMFRAFANILDIYHICYSAKTFTSKFYSLQPIYDDIRNAMRKHRSQYLPFTNVIGTLRNSSQSCEEMILFCLWLDNVHNCSELFKQIETDYGLCCTYNMIPLTLLRTFVQDPQEDPQQVKDWQDADIRYDNIIFDKTYKNRKYPYRQLYPGRSAGLSFLIEPNMEEYHCTNTDSDGFVVGLNVPLDFPRMKDNSLAIRTSTETFLTVRPEITVSANSAKKAKLDKRHCFFEGERKLKHYLKYTASNCLDECIAEQTLSECGCLRYYMPRTGLLNETLCLPTSYHCTETVKERMIMDGLKECKDCWPACTEIVYHAEITALRTREEKIQTLYQHHSNRSLNMKRAKNATIIHVYFNTDSVFPRLRKESTTTTEIISSAGGLLGLCMGLSMLSLLEIVYHATMRLCCNMYRKRSKSDKKRVTDSSNTQYNQPRNGFFSKLFSSSTFVTKIECPQSNETGHNGWADKLDSSTFITMDTSGTKQLPMYFRTPFETDFHRAYVSTTAWIQPLNYVDDPSPTTGASPTLGELIGEHSSACNKNNGFYYG